MARKTMIDVVIDGKVHKVGGYEDINYLQRVAAFINDKIKELESLPGFRQMPSATQSILVELNLADEYFKVRQQLEQLELLMQQKNKDLYDLKHDLSSFKLHAEQCKEELNILEQENERLKAQSLSAKKEE